MWSDVFAPQTRADLAWSPSKLNELVALTNSVVHGNRHVAILMYGPSGCGKAVTPRVAVPQLLGPDEVVVQEHHVGSSLTRPGEELERFLFGATCFGDGHPSGPPATVATAKKKKLLLRIVKLAAVDGIAREGRRQRGGFDPVLSILGCLERCVSSLERIDCRAMPITAVGSQFHSSITILVHTVHDCHSDKVNLNEHFSDRILHSSAVLKFHCTRVTDRAVRLRLEHVLKKESDTSGATQFHRRHLPQAALDSVVAAAHGDLRQALLQLQWASIDVSTGHAPTAAKKKNSITRATTSAKGHAAVVVVDVDDASDDNIEALTTSDDDVPARRSRLPPTGGSTRIRPVGVSSKRPRDGDDGAVVEATQVASRNEYIDVAHACARLLTQKYTVDQVCGCITAPLHVLAGYWWFNAHHYFGEDQMEAYATCIEAVSQHETFFTPSEQLDLSGSASMSSSAERREGYLASCGMELLQRCYSTSHRFVQIPRTFLSQRPPPPQTRCFPRVIPGRVDGDDDQQRGRANVLHRAETFPERGGSLSAIADVCREYLLPEMCGTLSLSDTILDYASILPKIVFEAPATSSMPTQVRLFGMNTGAASSTAHPCQPPPRFAATAPAPLATGAKRTMFRLTAPLAAPAAAPTVVPVPTLATLTRGQERLLRKVSRALVHRPRGASEYSDQPVNVGRFLLVPEEHEVPLNDADPIEDV